MPLCDIFSASVSFEDQNTTSNPILRNWSWNRSYTQIAVNNPKSDVFSITPSSSLSVFSGTRSLSTDGTTAITVTLNPLFSNIYRFTWVSGTAPVFRTNRNLNLNGIAVTVTVNNNAVATFTIPSGGSTFAGTIVGDNLWIPGPTTGDSATPFNVLNQGMWTVISVASNNLSISAVRLPGVSFSAAAEIQTLTSAGQLMTFSSAGVQVNDKVNITAGFSIVTQGLSPYIVSNVTPNFFEVSSSSPIPLESNIMPTASGLTIYSVAKRFVRVEADQPCVVQYNGDSTTINIINPLVNGDPNNIAYSEKIGTVWSLNIVNNSSIATTTVRVFAFE